MLRFNFRKYIQRDSRILFRKTCLVPLETKARNKIPACSGNIKISPLESSRLRICHLHSVIFVKSNEANNTQSFILLSNVPKISAECFHILVPNSISRATTPSILIDQFCLSHRVLLVVTRLSSPRVPLNQYFCDLHASQHRRNTLPFPHFQYRFKINNPIPFREIG